MSTDAQEIAERALAIRDKLLAWFDVHARDLPWRRTRDPYAVYLSEIMLQQTRVDTVIPYFERFVARYPKVTDLARAPIDDVLGLWSGLGYYRRARSLHLAAREVTERYQGAFPDHREGLESLPGIGAYTAGAIASIAFQKEEAIVDGNVARVLSRLFALEDRLGSKESTAKLWDLARTMVKGPRPGDLNQALMELGAMVCTPDPGCMICPVREHCEARAAGRERELPLSKIKTAPKRMSLIALVSIDAQGRALLAKRSMDGLFGGLWEPPMIDRSLLADGSLPAWLSRALAKGTSAGKVEHVLTHRVLEVAVTRAEHMKDNSFAAPPGYVEVKRTEVTSDLGLSRLARKVLAAALEAPPIRTNASATRPPKTKKRVVSPRKPG